MVFKALIDDVVMFNQQVSTSKDGSKIIGKIDEILGPVKKYLFTVTPSEGINVESIKIGQKIYLDQAFVLPLHIFTNPQKSSFRGGSNSRGGMSRGGPRGGFRGGFGGRGAPRGVFNNGRGSPRGGFNSRGSFNGNRGTFNRFN